MNGSATGAMTEKIHKSQKTQKTLEQGRFLSFEGSEGVGKSTQCHMLAAALRERAITVLTTREPGGTAGGDDIRKILLEGDHARWSARSEALLFAAARADHVTNVIRPALAEGTWVLCDRFVDSSRAYQGGGAGIADAEILALHRFGSGGLLPHRTFWLDVPQDIAMARLRDRDPSGSDRMGAKPLDYYQRLVERFSEIAAQEPQRWRRIPAAATPLEVLADILHALEDWL